ncbi:MAG TPA: L-threonylcarbamoyladenylate synthase [Bryobacteraceae bacterium]|jgi:L-threonylcarbamoyladenylate synthase|nr:L-threonylcarbamoyladenylate synthase [Bryobacteraceae bacterium]
MIVSATPANIAEAAEIIRRGGLVAFPTETVYGLGANALDADAVSRIFKAKERPFANPLIVHVADEAMARSLVLEWPALAETLASCFWPGPLTIVLRKAENVPDLVTAGLDSVGIRIPAHPVALALIRAAGVPVAAPSANRFTQLSPTAAQHVLDGMGERVKLILDGGPTDVGIESTVVSLRRTPPAILRPGMISQRDLESATGLTWQCEIEQPRIADAPAESPGQHPKHYAPRTPFHVLDANAPLPQGPGKLLEMPSDPDAYASCLYAALHAADREGWDWIAVRKPPETAEWAGIIDRLKRASAT